MKSLLLVLDHDPSLFMGDSGSYFNTALYGSIPGDRSFVYGFFLRSFAVAPHSLFALVLLQTALSAIAALLVGVCLWRYFHTSFAVAAIGSLLCAVEPLQLLSERFVLTEALATFLFAMFVLSNFEYLAHARLAWLVLAQIFGVCLISIRISFLPIVIFSSFALPLMSAHTVALLKSAAANRMPFIGTRLVRIVLVPLLLSLSVSQGLLFGYRHLYASLIEPPMHGHPAYFYRDGLFLAADFAPVVIPSDYPIAEQRAAVFGTLTVPLADRRLRDQQRWAPGGIAGRITAAFGRDEYRADAVARKTALRALKHHPFDILQLSAKTFVDYFDRRYLESTLITDEGLDRRLEAPLVADYRKDFGFDFGHPVPDSLTKRWHRKLFFWYEFLLLLPVLYWIYRACNWRKLKSAHWFSAIVLSAFLEGATVTVTRPTARFLTTMAWLAVIVLGAFAANFQSSSAEDQFNPTLRVR